MEKYAKYAGWVTSVIVAAIAVIGYIYNKGGEAGSIEGRMFDTHRQKVEVVKYVEESPSPEQKQRALILDSINKNSAIKSRSIRDSVFVEIRNDQLEMKQYLKVKDSVDVLNADQLYQIKQEIKKLKDN